MKQEEDLRRTIKDQRRHLGALNKKVKELQQENTELRVKLEGKLVSE